ncbi:MAG: hypothetical protein AAF449_18075 [Myxococcota bacterium]
MTLDSTDAWPQPDRTKLARIEARTLIEARLAVGPRSEGELQKALRGYIDKAAFATAFNKIKDEGRITPVKTRWALRTDVQQHPIIAAIIAAGLDWSKVQGCVLPAVALGLSPRWEVAKRFTKVDSLRASLIALLYKLPVAVDRVTLPQARESLLVFTLSAVLPKVPEMRWPAIKGDASLDKFSVTVLRGLTQLSKGNIVQTINTVAAEAVEAKDTSADALRLQLVKACVIPRKIIDGPGIEPPPIEKFAQRIQSITDERAAPPFEDRLAIGTLYDIYGRDHADAGSLASFKERIIAAFTKKLISLRRLDDKGLWDRETRDRSQVEYNDYRFHFVARTS